jgi:hypothetical protein
LLVQFGLRAEGPFEPVGLRWLRNERGLSQAEFELVNRAERSKQTWSLRQDEEGAYEVAFGQVDAVLTMLASAARVEDAEGRPLRLLAGEPVRLTLRSEDTPDGLRLDLEAHAGDAPLSIGELIVCGAPRAWVLCDDTFRPLANAHPAVLYADWPLTIPPSERPEFERLFRPELTMLEALPQDGLQPPGKVKPRAKLHFERQDGALYGEVRFVYDGLEVPSSHGGWRLVMPDGRWVRRHPEMETQYESSLRGPLWELRRGPRRLPVEQLPEIRSYVEWLVGQGWSVEGEEALRGDA